MLLRFKYSTDINNIDVKSLVGKHDHTLMKTACNLLWCHLPHVQMLWETLTSNTSFQVLCPNRYRQLSGLRVRSYYVCVGSRWACEWPVSGLWVARWQDCVWTAIRPVSGQLTGFWVVKCQAYSHNATFFTSSSNPNFQC